MGDPWFLFSEYIQEMSNRYSGTPLNTVHSSLTLPHSALYQVHTRGVTVPVNYEIKSQLAKLLATEDLLVEHKNVETASFNVDSRVLTLPMWDKASNNVYDLLVAHEVGHALFTPNVDWTEKVKINPIFVNITEDARIEKLMKRKYAGLSKTFYRGYSELNDDDFFSVEDEGVDRYGLADKVNLYFKIGNFVKIFH